MFLYLQKPNVCLFCCRRNCFQKSNICTKRHMEQHQTLSPAQVVAHMPKRSGEP